MYVQHTVPDVLAVKITWGHCDLLCDLFIFFIWSYCRTDLFYGQYTWVVWADTCPLKCPLDLVEKGRFHDKITLSNRPFSIGPFHQALSIIETSLIQWDKSSLPQYFLMKIGSHKEPWSLQWNLPGSVPQDLHLVYYWTQHSQPSCPFSVAPLRPD